MDFTHLSKLLETKHLIRKFTSYQIANNPDLFIKSCEVIYQVYIDKYPKLSKLIDIGSNIMGNISLTSWLKLFDENRININQFILIPYTNHLNDYDLPLDDLENINLPLKRFRIIKKFIINRTIQDPDIKNNLLKIINNIIENIKLSPTQILDDEQLVEYFISNLLKTKDIKDLRNKLNLNKFDLNYELNNSIYKNKLIKDTLCVFQNHKKLIIKYHDIYTFLKNFES